MLIHLYVVRLRSHAVQELLAGSGIAVGVALVLGVLVANTSLTSSASVLVHQVTGSARLQLSARSPEGFDQTLGSRAARLPGVLVAAPVLRENVGIVGPRGRARVQLLGVTPAAIGLGGLTGTGHSLAALAQGQRIALGVAGLRLGSILLPRKIAQETGATRGATIVLTARGSARPVRVSSILSGPAADNPVAVTSLTAAQRLTGLPGRITQVYVKPGPHSDALVELGLRRLAGGRLDVQAADRELALLEEAAGPNDQSTELFAAISVMVGFLLALNAMLLTVPERRRFVADLRMQGYDWHQVLVLLVFQAVALGLLASLAGVALGDLISHAFLHRVPVYLVTAFPIGSEQALSAGTVALAVACGIAATMLASLSPALDLRPSRPTDAVLRDREGGSETISAATTAKTTAAGAAAVAAITIVVLLVPSLTIAGGVALALATLSAIPGLFALLAMGLRWLGDRVRSSALIVVVSELRATTTRSVALAGIAALAVYGSVAIGGARNDLIRGLDSNFTEYLKTADIWVTTGGNDLTTNAFTVDNLQGTLERVRGVRTVRVYQGGFLDVGRRRMWVIARPSGDEPLLPSSQLISGNAKEAEDMISRGGWAAVSQVFASEHHLRLGSRFTIPTPTGTARLGVAAVTTNLGWAPGALILSSGDYRRWWGTSNPSALEIDLLPGVAPSAARRRVLAALDGRPGLGVQTFAERRSQYFADSRQGLQALSQIATLLLIAAALAVASALSAAIWQRRARLASLKIQGYSTGQLWRALLLESTVVLGVGCAVGAIFGVYGHALASRWLRLETGFPAPFTVGFGGVFLTLGLLAAIALAVISLPGLAAARAPARATFQE
jgi:putative ABC transport system permease protein